MEVTPLSRFAASSNESSARKLTCAVFPPSIRPARRASSRAAAALIAIDRLR